MMRQDTTFCTSIKFCPWANNIHINSLIWQYSSPSTLPMGNFGMPSMYYLCTTTTTTANEKKKIKKRELINKCARYSLLALMLFIFSHIRHAVNAKRRSQESTIASSSIIISTYLGKKLRKTKNKINPKRHPMCVLVLKSMLKVGHYIYVLTTAFNWLESPRPAQSLTYNIQNCNFKDFVY